MTWRQNFEKGKELVLSTSSKDAIPNANIVISLGFVEDKLLVANCQMNTTIKNLKENRKICVVGGYCRIKGEVEIFSNGEYLDICQNNSGDYGAKNAILITIKEVFDLDKVEKIE